MIGSFCLPFSSSSCSCFLLPYQNIWEYIYNSCSNVLILPFYSFCHWCHFWVYSLISFSLSKEPHFPESLSYLVRCLRKYSYQDNPVDKGIIFVLKGYSLWGCRVDWGDWARTRARVRRHCEFYIFSSAAFIVCVFVVNTLL